MAKVKKKTCSLDPTLVKRLRRIYRTKSDTEAVVRALEDAIFRERVKKAIRATAGKSPGMEKVF